MQYVAVVFRNGKVEPKASHDVAKGVVIRAGPKDLKEASRGGRRCGTGTALRWPRGAEVPFRDDSRGAITPEFGGQTSSLLGVVRQEGRIPVQDPIFMGR